MADSNNYSDLNDNFDTIKTMLNSIRAQGILNTSDVDKLLEGINSKLEKINTEEDIDLIKAFLSELKKNLDERHEVLISKFGAIESLFSNLMKNSNDTVKSPELKELFDIIATNLSVFSREVVSQKETMTDISLRLDAMRSDETQKKDIIKSVSTVRNDIEKVNNAFDSIVISLNENFKTVLKTISDIDQSEAISEFSNKLAEILDSSNAVMSAIQLIDKKNVQIEDTFKGLATQEDINNVQKNINQLSAQSQEITSLVDTLTQKSYKIDNLSDKIDATVDIIVGLKAELLNNDDSSKLAVIDKLNEIETAVKEASSSSEYEDIKKSFEALLNEVLNGSNQLKTSMENALNQIENVNEVLRGLDINVELQKLSSHISNVGEDIKEKVVSEADKISQIIDAHISRTLDDISSKAELFNARLKDSNVTISNICEKNFAEVAGNISGLKEIVAQLDENNVSANNAIFSNITDRLSVFENSLKNSLEKQENFVSGSSSNIFEQISNMKSLTEGLDYKLDANAIELGNAKNEFKELSEAVNNLLATDFVNVVKDFKADLYAIKQDMTDAVENAKSDISEKSANDLFGKYELLISKLDSVEDEVKFAQGEALNTLKTQLSSISASIVDVLSYVSNAKESNYEVIENKLSEVTTFIQDTNLNYIENVRDIVDVIRTQVENNLRQISSESDERLNKIKAQINDSGISVKQDIKTAYDKIIELQSDIAVLNDDIKSNNSGLMDNVNNVLDSANTLKSDFETKLTSLKNSLLEIVTEYKNDFTCKNADNISELKFNAENLHSKAQQQSVDLKNELKEDISNLIESLKLNILDLNEIVSKSSLKVEASNKDIVDFIKHDFTSEVNNSVDSIKNNTSEILSEVSNKLDDSVSCVSKLDASVTALNQDTKNALSGTLAKILENFVSLNSTIVSLDENSQEKIQINIDELRQDIDSLKKKLSDVDSQIDDDLAKQINIIEGSFESLNLMLVDIMNQATDSLGDKIKKELSGASSRMSESLAEELEQYKVQIEELFEGVQSKNNEQADYIKNCTQELNNALQLAMDKQGKESAVQLEEIGNHLKSMIHENVELTTADYETLKNKLESFLASINEQNDNLVNTIKTQIEILINNQEKDSALQLEHTKTMFEENAELTSASNNSLKEKLEGLLSQINEQNNNLTVTVKTQLDDVAKYINSNFDIQTQEVNSVFEEIESSIQKIVSTVREFRSEYDLKFNEIKTSVDDFKQETTDRYDVKNSELNNKIETIIEEEIKPNFTKITEIVSTLRELRSEYELKFEEVKTLIDDYKQETTDKYIDENSKLNSKIETIIEEEIKPSFTKITEQIDELLKGKISDFVTQYTNSNSELSNNISSEIEKLKADFIKLNEKLNADEFSRVESQEQLINDLNNKFNEIINEIKNSTNTEFTSLKETIKTDCIASVGNIEQTLATEVAELQTAVKSINQNIKVCQDIISALTKEHTELISKEVEKETDIIIGEIVEQFDLIKASQKDDMTALTSAIENSVSGYIIDSVNDLKSYMDIKTDTSLIDSKLDTLRIELSKTLDDTIENINKLLEVSVFSNTITDLKATNEVLLSTTAEKINSQIQEFVKENVYKKIDDKLNLLDKKFIDTIVDKYEEAKILSTQYNKTFEGISSSVDGLLNEFKNKKDEIQENFKNIFDKLNGSVDELKSSFADLKAQIMNKSFDEAFHTSVHNQISGIENLVQEQLGYIQDINELCSSNLPELTEMNTIVKYGIKTSLEDIQEKLSRQDSNVTEELNNLKSDIITQFINVFNQISFVTEQEEILEFIDEKHSELITILSHIVTTMNGVESVKDNISNVDNKITSLKKDIDIINDKITSIMSSEGDVDYVYSLQDLESDIANLRLVLNEMKENNKSKEFEELISSTNNIYSVVESIKAELPRFEAEEFRKDFDNLAEDIVSISTRTNKLILTSDESYKTLQDNLQDFKLVIDDLDERTRNFAKESGIDKIDNKLGVINTMMQNGAKTNQVFNQVFEYLAEWVDKAGEQISSISDKVETLDDIGQIKVMLEDLRAESHDNTESVELVNALESVFDKQAKRIASLEAKIDRMVVDSTINSKQSKINMKPIEDTLNKFLAAIGDTMSNQQEKINSLETKLEEVVSLIDNKDTAQLTKKVGGMDKQLAKLNKSIEKIASNVVEK